MLTIEDVEQIQRLVVNPINEKVMDVKSDIEKFKKFNDECHKGIKDDIISLIKFKSRLIGMASVISLCFSLVGSWVWNKLTNGRG